MNCLTRRPASLCVCLLLMTSGALLRAQTASLSTKTLSYGNQAIGTSVTKSVVLKNTGTAALIITSISKPGAPFTEGDNCPIGGSGLVRYASCTLAVTFSPTTKGVFTGSISIADNATGSPQTIGLSGTGVAAVTLSPASQSFGKITLGNSSAPETFTLQNVQNVALTISSITITPSAGFSLSNSSTPCPISPNTLAKGATCSIVVTFSPSSMGAVSGTLSVAHSALGSPTTATLSGTGISPVTLSPMSLSFGSQNIGTTSKNGETIEVTNVQPVALSITSIQATGDFSETNTCPTTLAAGMGCPVTVKFSPTAAGTRSGQLLINDGAVGSPQTAALTGNGVAVLQSIAISPTTATITVGQTKQFTATGTYNDKTTKDITTSANWSSSKTSVATVSGDVATGVANGTATITASLSGVKGTTTLTVGGVAPPVISSFSAGAATITAGSSTTLTAVFSGGTGAVNNGVGAVTSGTAVTVKPTATTTYTLTVTNTAGTTVTATATVTVVPPPTITSFTAGAATITSGNSTTLTGVFSGGTGSINGVGAVTSGVAVTVKPPATTTYTLTVTNTAGTSVTATATVTVVAPPTITSFTAASATITAGNSTTLTGVFSGGTGAIIGVGGAISGSPLTVTPTTTTTYTLTVTNTAGTTVTATATVTVVSPPSITSFTAGAATITTGNSTTLTGVFSGGTGSVNGVGNATSGSPVTVTPTVTTTYTLTVTNSAGTSVTATALVTVVPPPTITGFTAAAATITAGNSTTLTATFSGGTAAIDNGAGAPTSGSPLTVSPTATTTYTLTVTNTAGTAVTATVTVTVLPPPTIASFTAAAATITTGNSTTLTATFSGGTAAIDNGVGSVSSGTPITVTPTATTTYTLTVTNAANSTTTSNVTVTVNAVTLTSIAVTSTTSSLVVGSTQQFVATGTYSDTSTQTLTTTATWTSSAPAAATISSGGLATAVGLGTTTITATYNGVSGSTTIAVTGTGKFNPGGLMNFARDPFTATLLDDGTVLIAGGYGSTGALNSAELADPSGTNPLTLLNNPMTSYRAYHTATLLPNGMVLLAGGVDNTFTPLATAELYDPVRQTFTATAGSLSHPRYQHTATLLSDGTVLFAGGIDSTNTTLTYGEIYNPVTGQFTLTGNLNAARYAHTATLLNDGTVFITGGATDSIFDTIASAESYSPTTKLFTNVGAMTYARAYHTATLLNDGTVLVAGGVSGTNYPNPTNTAEIYVPGNLSFNTYSILMSSARAGHTATLLNNGLVLIAGGAIDSNGNYPNPIGTPTTSTELYDPNFVGFYSTTDTTGAVTSLGTARTEHTATLLTNGQVIIAGGAMDVNGTLTNTTELYQPVSSTPPTLQSIAVTPSSPATLSPGTSQQFIATGTFFNGFSTFTQQLASVTWSATDVSGTGVAQVSNDAGTRGLAVAMNPGTATITATLGSFSSSVTLTVASLSTITVSPANPQVPLGLTQQFTAMGSLSGRASQDLTSKVVWSSSVPGVASISPSGLVSTLAQGSTTITATLGAFGTFGAVSGSTTSTVAQPALVSIAVAGRSPMQLGATQTFTVTGTYTNGSQAPLAGSAMWSSSASNVASIDSTGLASGGSVGVTTITASVGALTGSSILYVTDVVPTTSVMHTPRLNHTATLLDNGKVLIAGGADYTTTAIITTATAELYDPTTGTFNYTTDASSTQTNMANPRQSHTASLLPTGTVLIAGGGYYQPGTLTILSGAEIYDPNSGTFSSTASLNQARDTHAATVLSDGTVLVTGGHYYTGTGATLTEVVLNSAEVYNSASQSWTTLTNPMVYARLSHTSTLLPSGKVLIAGGTVGGFPSNTAEIYDPVAGTFTAVPGGMAYARQGHTATLMDNGVVLIAGGVQGVQTSPADPYSAELYDPQNNTFTKAADMTAVRVFHTAVALPNGTVLIAGGGPLATEVYDPFNNTFTVAGALNADRSLFTATLLDTGSVLLAAGISLSTATTFSSADVYTPLTLTPPNLVSIAVTPANPTTIVGAAQRLVAMGTFTVNGITTITPLSSVTWSATDLSGSGVAQISNDASNSGEAAGLSAGTATITACAGICGSTTLTVNPALVSIVVAPGSPAISAGTTLSFTATGHYSNNTTQDLTASATWSSSATIVASIDSAGLASSVTQGSTTITATFGTTSGSTALTVGPPLNAIAVTPVNPIQVGATAQFTAIGIFSDGSTQNLSTSFTPPNWTSGSAIATIDPVSGLATGVAPGEANIFATLGAITGSTPLYVTNVASPAASSMLTARSGETATLLATGKVLVTGGWGTYGSGSGLSSAELYTPVTGGYGTFAATDSLLQGVFFHTATVLPSGKVLIAGGQLVNASPSATTQAEVYDPATGTFTPAAGLLIPRQQHTATLLPSGLVLIVGGYSQSQGNAVSSAELYDPVAGTFTLTLGSLATARYGHTATLLNDGRVLIVGGYNFTFGEQSSAEIYDPVTQMFTAAGSLTVAAGFGSTATLLPSGKVLFAAGINGAGSAAPTASKTAELYDPTLGTFTQTGSLTTGRFFHTATLEADGKVLFVGGQVDGGIGTPTFTAELYDPSMGTNGTFTPTVALNTARDAHAAALLSDGTVLIMGGVVSSVLPAPNTSTLSVTPTVEFYPPL
jgi:hypothetical protein